ncbi:Coiled-coil-helix-coiled-coil-helix domain-containing protein 2 [Balamuthia mandrillaris]
MGRRSGFGSSRRTTTRTATPSRSAPAPAPRKQAAPPAPTPTPTPTAATTPMAPQRGGFLRNVAELGTGIAVGHVAGHALENLFFGGRHASPEQIQEVQREVKSGPCSVQYEAFERCLKASEDDASKCDWAFDMFKTCQFDAREKASFDEMRH